MSIEITSNGVDASTGSSMQRIGLLDGAHEATFEIDLEVDLPTQTIAEANRIAADWSSAGRKTGPREILSAIVEGTSRGAVRDWCANQATQDDEVLELEPTEPEAAEDDVDETPESVATESTEFSPASDES